MMFYKCVHIFYYFNNCSINYRSISVFNYRIETKITPFIGVILSIIILVELVEKNWHQIVSEQIRWRELLCREWSLHMVRHIPGG